MGHAIEAPLELEAVLPRSRRIPEDGSGPVRARFERARPGAATYVLKEVFVMDERSSTEAHHVVMHRSWWSYLLPIVWVGLGARIVVALVRGESLREDFLSLALVAFVMTTSLLGSRVWLWVSEHWTRFDSTRRPELRHH